MRKYCHKQMCRRKSSFRRLGVLLLLAVVGFGTHLDAADFKGPAAVNEGIKLWLDAAKKNVKRKRSCDRAIKPNKNWVHCWKDISGNNAHVTTYNKPYKPPKHFGTAKWVDNVIGGKPALYFEPDGERALIKMLGDKKWEGNYTLFLVVKQEQSNPLEKSSYFSGGNNTDSMQIGHGADDTTKDSVWVWMNDSEDSSTRFTDSSEIESRIYAVRDGDTKRRTYTNGKLESTDTIENGRKFTDYQINLDRTRKIFNGSYIAEVILYSRNLDDCEFYDVHKYLADKYELRGDPVIADGLTPEHHFLNSGDPQINPKVPGDPNYFVIHSTADLNLPTVHTGGDNDIIYIKDWGKSRDSSVNGANPKVRPGDHLIFANHIWREEDFCPDEMYFNNHFDERKDWPGWNTCKIRWCFTSGGSICVTSIESVSTSSGLDFDYGGLITPESCEEDVCVGGNIAPVGVPAPVSFSSRSLGSDTLVFQGLFNFDDWSGNLLAYELKDDGSLFDDDDPPKWRAAEMLESKDLSATTDWTSYNDSTGGSSTGKKFEWSELEGIQKEDLEFDSGSGGNRLKYLRGDHSNEQDNDGNNGDFRFRDNSRLGDIFRSRPVYVGVPNLAWPDTGEFDYGEATRYSDFSTAQQSRTPMVYVGANDGALHGFRADTGVELLRYFPGNLYDDGDKAGYHFLTDPDYDHLPYVDGTPVVSDAYIKKTPSGAESWRTILVGTQGGGGSGLFALDITDPEIFNNAGTSAEDVVLWEFTQANFGDLGYTYSRPTIALLNDGRWAAITGNGDAPGGLDGSLLILYLEGGIADWSGEGLVADYIEIPTNEIGGLSSPTVIDTDGDGDADRAYAGDTEGNLWVFDLSSEIPDNWEVANGGDPLFENTRDDPQPITVKPTVVRHPTVSSDDTNAPNVMVLFGTGRLNTEEDKSDTAVQTFYGIWDRGDKNLTASDDLVAQEFVVVEDENTRITNPSLEVNYTGGEFGWYIDLPDTGERVVSDAIARGDMIFFNTAIPNDDLCAYGGTGWEMLVRIENGGSPMSPVVDQDNNNIVDSRDASNIDLGGDEGITAVGISGKKIDDDEGLPGGPAIVGDKLFTRGSTEGKQPKDTTLASVTGSAPVGRLSWEQLFPSQ
jgi:hypothetical protein